MSAPAFKGASAPTRRLALRQQLEAAIEEAIAALDAFDGDADLEDTADEEPTLSVPEIGWSSRSDDAKRWAGGGDTNEREDVSEDEAAQCEGEGDYNELEPEDGVECTWQDEGDQTHLRRLDVFRKHIPRRSRHCNVGRLMPVRVVGARFFVG